MIKNNRTSHKKSKSFLKLNSNIVKEKHYYYNFRIHYKSSAIIEDCTNEEYWDDVLASIKDDYEKGLLYSYDYQKIEGEC